MSDVKLGNALNFVVFLGQLIHNYFVPFSIYYREKDGNKGQD